MNLQEWCKEAEKIDYALGKEYWNMEVGLPYDKDNIKNLEESNLKLSEFFVNNLKEPRELFLHSVGGIAGSKTYHLAIQLKEERQKHIKTEINGKKVDWNSWRQFVVKATDQERKEVFDTFIKQVPEITPFIKERFDACQEIYNQYNLEPLSDFCEESRITLPHLKSVLDQLQSIFQKKFLQEWKFFSNKFLKRDPEYYDDLYFIRNIVYEDLLKEFEHVNALEEIEKLFKSMGLDSSRITVDKEEREGKFPSPFCSFTSIPKDIRVSYKAENPLNTTVSVFHEFGHAIHASNIKEDLEYWKKYTMSNALAETFSTFFENLISNKLFLTKRLNISEEHAEEIRRRINFVELFAIMFYVANSKFRVEYWEKKLPFEAQDELYAKHFKECMGLDIPGKYWQLHHILPESLMYVPAYLLAMIKAQEIEDDMIERYGQEWWDNPKSHEYMLNIIESGTDSPINDYTKVNPKLLIQE